MPYSYVTSRAPTPQERHRPEPLQGERLTEIVYLDRVATCGRWALSDTAGLAVNPADGAAGWQNIHTCGKVWTCPTCSARILRQRVEELQELISKHAGPVGMVTLTQRHYRCDRLKELRQLLAAAWKRCLSGRAWQELRQRFGITGYVRALDLTHGPHGWHPHYHVLFLFRRQLTDRDARQLRRELYIRWARALQRLGRPAPSYAAGVHYRHGDAGAAEYVAKLKVACEITSGTTKQARQDGRTALQLLADYTLYQREADWRLYLVFLRSMRGARQLTWSHGLKQRFKIGALTDEEAAAQPDPRERLVLLIDATIYKQLAAHRGARGRVRAAAEAGGAAAATQQIFEEFRAIYARDARCTGPPGLMPWPEHDFPDDPRWWVAPRPPVVA